MDMSTAIMDPAAEAAAGAGAERAKAARREAALMGRMQYRPSTQVPYTPPPPATTSAIRCRTGHVASDHVPATSSNRGNAGGRSAAGGWWTLRTWADANIDRVRKRLHAATRTRTI